MKCSICSEEDIVCVECGKVITNNEYICTHLECHRHIDCLCNAKIYTVVEAAERTNIFKQANKEKQTMKEKLLPCPFCGSEASIVFLPTDFHKRIHCSNCHITTPYLCNKDELIKIWNTRYKPKENKSALAKQIIDYLNLKTGKHFKASSNGALKHINQRIREGFALDNFKEAIDNMCDKWLNTDMEDYLRPETLFGNKMDGYVNIRNGTRKDDEYYIKTYGKPKPKGAVEIIDEKTGDKVLKTVIDGFTYFDKPIRKE